MVTRGVCVREKWCVCGKEDLLPVCVVLNVSDLVAVAVAVAVAEGSGRKLGRFLNPTTATLSTATG